MANTMLTHRLARRDDLHALRGLMEAAISTLQKPFLDECQTESSRTIMGLDTQLIDDGTYFIVEIDGALAGCGGWSRRATLYGGDQSLDAAVRCSIRLRMLPVCGRCTHIHNTRVKASAG